MPPPQQLPATPNICAWMWDYEQGLMIGSAVLLYRISCQTTCDQSYQNSAMRTANASLDYYTLDWLWSQSPWFNAVYFVNPLALDHYAPAPRIRASLEAYLERT